MTFPTMLYITIVFAMLLTATTAATEPTSQKLSNATVSGTVVFGHPTLINNTLDSLESYEVQITTSDGVLLGLTSLPVHGYFVFTNLQRSVSTFPATLKLSVSARTTNAVVVDTTDVVLKNAHDHVDDVVLSVQPSAMRLKGTASSTMGAGATTITFSRSGSNLASVGMLAGVVALYMFRDVIAKISWQYTSTTAPKKMVRMK
eukprot:PhM_4_TR13591/c0_g1_i1/m.63714